MVKKSYESKFLTIVQAMKVKIEQQSLPEDLLIYLCEQLVLVTGFPGVWIGIKTDGCLVTLAGAGEMAKYFEQQKIDLDGTPFGKFAAGQAIQSGKVQFYEPGKNDVFSSWFPVLKKLKINNLISIPITNQGDEVGAITVCTTKKVDEYSLEQIALVTSFAGQVSMIIALQRSRNLLEKYRLLLENTQEIVFLLEQDGKIVEANRAAINTYGYTREELQGLYIYDFRADISQYIGRQINKARETGIVFETVHKTKNGKLFPVEISFVGEEINGKKLLISIVRDISNRKQIEKDFQSNKKEMTAIVSFLKTHDILTGLPNRTVFARKLKEEFEQELGKPFAVFFLDVDRFKFINDNFGQDIGDLLLIQITERIKQLLRPGDICCRYGGDEFAILVNSRKNPSEIYEIASKIINKCFQKFKIRRHDLYISVSVGIAIYPENGRDIDSLLKHADIAMYTAKQNGGNRFQVYVSEKDSLPFKSYSLLGNLNKALKRNEFLLYYQPQLDLRTGEVKGMEALLRWVSPTGLINPGDFIPLAEDTGLIIPIGDWVIKTACEQSQKWQEKENRKLEMSVNISAKQFYQPGFVSNLERILDDMKLDPKLLNFEITESIAMKNFELASLIIQGLSNSGISITIDDFGTGYSSLNYLANLNLDYLKIDKSLIKDLDKHNKKNSVVKGIISIAHNLGMKVIAEGVEKQEELDFLIKHDCDLVQGFYIGYPLPVE